MNEIKLGLKITDPDNGDVYILDVREDVTPFELFNIYQLITSYQNRTITYQSDVIRYLYENGINRHFTKE